MTTISKEDNVTLFSYLCNNRIVRKRNCQKILTKCTFDANEIIV